MFFIRQGATHKVVLGPAVAVGDGFTPVVNLDIATADEAEAILHDNGTVVDISGYTWAAITTADGYYHLTLQAAISGTVGHLTIVVNDDDLILPLRADFTVLDTAAYDAHFKDAAAGPLQATVAGRKLDVNAAGEAGLDFDNTSGTIDAAQLGADCITSAKIANDAISAEHINTGAFTADAFAANALTANTFAANSLDGKGDWNIGKAGYTLTNLSDANAAKLEHILDGTGGTGITLNSLVINGNAAGGVVDIDNAGGPGIAVNGSTLGVDIDGAAGSAIQATGTSHGLEIAASAGPGVEIDGTTFGVDIDCSNGPGIQIDSANNHAVYLQGGGAGSGLYAVGGATNAPGIRGLGNGSGAGIYAEGGNDGHGIQSMGGALTGDGIYAAGQTAGAGQYDLNADIHGTLDTVTTVTTTTDVTNDVGITAAAVDAIWDEVLTGATHNVPTSAGRRLRLAEDTTVLLDGTATAGGANTIQLQEGASADDNSYRYTLIVLTGGTGAGQARHVESYNGGTRTITVDREWVTNPDDTTEYTLYPWSRTHVHVLGSGAIVAASFAANSLDAATFAANSLNGKGDWNTVEPATQAQLNDRTLPADDYATKAICSETRLAQLDAANLPADIGEIPTTKTGYKLASDGLDAVATTAPAGVAGNFREMMVQLFRRFFKKSTLTSTELKTYADNGTDVLTTQAVSDDGTTQTQEASS